MGTTGGGGRVGRGEGDTGGRGSGYCQLFIEKKEFVQYFKPTSQVELINSINIYSLGGHIPQLTGQYCFIHPGLRWHHPEIH